MTPEQPGFRIVFAHPPGGAPTYTTISSDHGFKTTVISAITAAVKAGANQVKLMLRITGGDRNGGPLPSPTTNTFEQTIETVGNARIRLAGPAALLLDRCPSTR